MGGAYLSRPVKEKISENGSNSRLSYGVSSMQGWRLKQEDAHNCILDFDENTSLFGVYDGHGGFEVAKYTSEKFPTFLRNTKKYQEHNYREALIEAYLGFDDTIPTPEVMAVLKDMVKADDGGDSECDESSEVLVVRGSAQVGCSSNSDEGDEDLENPETLRADANKPIEEVMASYRVPSFNLLKSESAMPSSPFLRGRKEPTGKVPDETASSSAAGCSSSTSSAATSNSTLNGGTSESTSNDTSKSTSPPNQGSNSGAPQACPLETAKNSCEPSLNGTVSPVDDDISGVADTNEKRTKQISGEALEKNTSGEIPSISPKKTKKLGLDDLDDSATVKNFITSDEIAEDDEEDSEDETFQPSDELLDSDDDGEDDYQLSKKNSLAKHFLKCLNQVGRMGNDDDEDDDDSENEEEDDESESESTETDNENGSASPQSDDGVVDEGIEDEDADLDEENLEEESAEESECEDDDVSAQLMPDMSEKPGIDSGCTAVVALLKGRDLFVANAGDSRCIVCKAGQAVDMSEDHKPEDEIECNRIVKAGGKVTFDGRVDGGLNLSRAIGDHFYKKNKALSNTEQMITALPDVRTLKLEPDVEFMVLACDGIWNSMTSQEVVDFIRPKIQEDMSLSSICEQLFDKCLAPDTLGDGTGCDNMTCIIVKPSYSEIETPTVVSNGTVQPSAETNVVGPSGDASTKSEPNGGAERSAEIAENGIASGGDATEKSETAITKADDQQNNGSLSDNSKTESTKQQKRCAEGLVADGEDNSKRQKTDTTNLGPSSQGKETS